MHISGVLGGYSGHDCDRVLEFGSSLAARLKALTQGRTNCTHLPQPEPKCIQKIYIKLQKLHTPKRVLRKSQQQANFVLQDF